ncbi:MAG TPA: hypothetical protein VLT17_06850 [Gemmatimonadales bacterium]|jgi:predicted protein tyrosine phosphatase|nr:hypothetical protein [Gemmatimonadales bacterium]
MTVREQVLFVCTHNISRSYTAEYLFLESAEYDVRSAGTSFAARVPVSEELVSWATRIFVMEQDHADALWERFGELLIEKKIVCLEIPDIYDPLEPALIMVLEERLAPYLTIPPKQDPSPDRA